MDPDGEHAADDHKYTVEFQKGFQTGCKGVPHLLHVDHLTPVLYHGPEHLSREGAELCLRLPS
nr:MAG TPA: hypothetical protein [Caudoviricetes sp.]